MMISHMVSMSFCSSSVSNRFLNSSWNSMFFDPIRMTSTLGGHLVNYYLSFSLYVQFDVAHNQSVVSSNVDLVDDCYIRDDIWPVC